MAQTSYEDDIALLSQEPDQWPTYSGYLPLDESKREIRLLSISLDETSNAIHGHIEHKSLDEDPVYEALSYCWGPPSQLEAIYIDDEEVRIRKSLWSFLYTLCLNRQRRSIWVDSVCINQRDHHERSWQVQIMGEVYSKALVVNVWLGESNPGTEYAFSYMRCITDPRILLTESSTRVKSLARDGAYDILTRPYWKRLWVVQELVLAQDIIVYCGLRYIPWIILCKFMEQYDTCEAHDNHLKEAIAEIESTRNQILNGISTASASRSPTIAQLVKSFSRKQCADGHDKIFALRSLAAEGRYISVNYLQSVADTIFETCRILNATSADPYRSLFATVWASYYWPSISQIIRAFDLADRATWERRAEYGYLPLQAPVRHGDKITVQSTPNAALKLSLSNILYSPSSLVQLVYATSRDEISKPPNAIKEFYLHPQAQRLPRPGDIELELVVPNPSGSSHVYKIIAQLIMTQSRFSHLQVLAIYSPISTMRWEQPFVRDDHLPIALSLISEDVAICKRMYMTEGPKYTSVTGYLHLSKLAWLHCACRCVYDLDDENRPQSIEKRQREAEMIREFADQYSSKVKCECDGLSDEDQEGLGPILQEHSTNHKVGLREGTIMSLDCFYRRNFAETRPDLYEDWKSSMLDIQEECEATRRSYLGVK